MLLCRSSLQAERLADVQCAAVTSSTHILPYRGMQIVINENSDKGARIVNGHDATLVSSYRKIIVVQFPDGERAFVYPVTQHVKGEGDVARYPYTPTYTRTISKS